MSVYERGRFWWCDFTVNGRRQRLNTGLTVESSKTAAKKVEAKLRESAALGLADPLTLEQAAGIWFVAKIEGKPSAESVARRLEIMLRLVGPYRLVTTLDAPDFAAAIAARRLEATRQSTQKAGSVPKPVSNSTVNRDLIDTTLRPIWNYCRKTLKQRVAVIDWNDLRLEEPTGRTRTFKSSELDGWADALPAWHVPVRDFIGRYGVRLREAFFHPDRYDPASGRITIRPADRKNKQAHTLLLLPEDAAEMNARWGRAKAAGLSTVWFREWPDGELTEIHWRGYQSASRKALDRAGIEDARPTHDLRHHACTTLLRGTGNLAAVQRLAGHKNMQSTMRYAHLDDTDVFNALRHTYVTSTAATDEKDSENNAVVVEKTGT